MKNPLLIIIVIICAVLGISFYEAERRKESFENIPTVEGKVLEPSDLYNVEKQSNSEAFSNSQENSINESKSDFEISQMETGLDYSNQENEEESNDDERTLTCQYCDDNFMQKKVTVYVMGTSYNTWSGGANHCDPNWGSRSENNLKVNWSGSSKYCSRKCACKAGED